MNSPIFVAVYPEHIKNTKENAVFDDNNMGGRVPVSAREGSLNCRKAPGSTFSGVFSATPPKGFSLMEMMMAILILTFGLLAVSQLFYVSFGSGSLARSKAAAAIQAQSQIEYLSDLYRRNPSAADLTAGNHGPKQVQVINPVNDGILNRFNLTWTVTSVPDSRPGKVLPACQVNVTATPVGDRGTENKRIFFNKVVNITSIISKRTQ